nr:hypothetical protein [Rickettsia rhipicephali]
MQLSKQLNPDSIWYRARKFLIERYNQYIDFGVLSKLVVVEEDIVNKKVILKSLLGIFPAACGVIWRNEQIYTQKS